jgi:hypothetical protein
MKHNVLHCNSSIGKRLCDQVLGDGESICRMVGGAWSTAQDFTVKRESGQQDFTVKRESLEINPSLTIRDPNSPK